MLSPRKINTFLFFKLPAAWITGVRVNSIDSKACTVSVKHKWINQNPFKSMYFAVQAMAAELSTGALVMSYIRSTGKPVSMLVLQNESSFHKKARGRIQFSCRDGQAIQRAIETTVQSGEPQTVWMESEGVDESGDTVSNFRFRWTVKPK